jgi:hypothetical protein
MFTFIVLPLLVVALLAATVGVYRLPLAHAWVVVGAAWSVYAVYEALMYARILCSGDCNIRVDLLAIWPALLLISGAAVVSSIVRRG